MPDPSAPTSGVRFATTMVCVWLTGMVLLLVRMLASTDGHLVYTLDDPYIHLAVSENILRGGYGVNFPAFSTPSSSLLYPFLLVPGIALGWGELWPLVLNLVAMAAAVWGLSRFAHTYLSELPTFDVGLLVGVGLLGINAYGLPMMGMEHSLHVLLVVIAIRGIAAMEDGHPPGPSIVGALGLLPLLRFEGLALAGAGMALLAWRGHRRAAAMAASLIVGAFLAWWAFTQHMGLPFLPSSVMVKSLGPHGEASTLSAVIARLADTLINSRPAYIYWLYLLGLGFFGRRIGPHRAVAWTVGAALGAHLLFGREGWFHRYEMYANTMLLMAMLLVSRSLIQRLYVDNGKLLVLCTGMLVVFAPPVLDLAMVPAASRNIHDQQYQMHRFVTEAWREPVAVNDLGWVSYRNDAFVLDLWGLGSEEVRRMRADGSFDADRIDAYTREAGVELAMLYEDAFVGQVPTVWCRLGVMSTPRVTAADTDVAFFALSPEAARRAEDALAVFVPTLPPRVTWTQGTGCPDSLAVPERMQDARPVTPVEPTP